MTAPATFRPQTDAQLTDAIGQAVCEKMPLEVRGHGSREAFGRLPPDEQREATGTLDMSAMQGIIAYDPGELVMCVRAGTPLGLMEVALSEHRQCLAFEPVDSGVLFGTGAASPASTVTAAGTAGGMVATGLAGPGRLRHGGVRDHVLGFHAVSGRGEVFKSGGNVIKNVTGFDLSKIMCGSFGTLAVMADITFKVIPAAQKVHTVLIAAHSPDTATEIMLDALRTSNELTAAAWLPPLASTHRVHALLSEGGLDSAAQGVVLLRVEGPAPSVAVRVEALRARYGKRGANGELHTVRSRALWQMVRDATPLLPPGDQATDGQAIRPLWRLSIPPTAAPAVCRALSRIEEAVLFLDWGGALVYCSTAPADDAYFRVVRDAVRIHGGHATLLRGEAKTRKRIAVFQPLSSAVMDLEKRIKAQFDPLGLLNRGRMRNEE